MELVKEFINMRMAFRIFVGVSCLALVYHALVMTQVISYANAWGGRLPNLHAMYVFEAFSVISQLLFIALAYARYKKFGGTIVQRVISAVFYVIATLLLLNTIGNAISLSLFEAILFTPITLFMSVVALRLAAD